jgi:hypothetical protein
MSDPNPNSNPDPSINPIFNPNPDPHKNKFKPDPEAMAKLNPKVFPELAHCRSKYTNPQKDHFILAYFIGNNDGS